MQSKYIPGTIIKGKVSGIEKYGIFLNFEDGYSGMIHISEVSDKFVKDLNSYALLNEIIPCKILSVDEEKKKIKLTIKNLDYDLRREEYPNEEFVILKQMLPIWMEEKLTEIKKENI